MSEDTSSSPAQQAEQQAWALMADPKGPYRNRDHPEHEKAKVEVGRLFEQAFPDRPMEDAPAPAAIEQAAAQFMRENFAAYRDKGHPDHARVVQEYRRRLEGRTVPDFHAPPAAKPSESPKLLEKPAAPADQVPPTPSEYRFAIPPPPEGETWAPTTWPAILGDAHTAGLTQRQAQSWASFVAASILPLAVAGGFEAVATEKLLGAAAQRLKWLGVPDAQARRLLERGVERLIPLEPRAPVDTSELETRQRELMTSPEYHDRFHPRHRATLAAVHDLAERITRRKGG